jgi:hypothetical protein
MMPRFQEATYVNCSAGPSGNTFGWWELKIDSLGNITAYLNGAQIGSAPSAAQLSVPMSPFASVVRNISAATNYHLACDALFLSYPYTR